MTSSRFPGNPAGGSSPSQENGARTRSPRHTCSTGRPSAVSSSAYGSGTRRQMPSRPTANSYSYAPSARASTRRSISHQPPSRGPTSAARSHWPRRESSGAGYGRRINSTECAVGAGTDKTLITRQHAAFYSTHRTICGCPGATFSRHGTNRPPSCEPTSRGSRSRQPDVGALHQPAQRIKSIAVLPLADLSDGMADALITERAQVGPPSVISLFSTNKPGNPSVKSRAAERCRARALTRSTKNQVIRHDSREFRNTATRLTMWSARHLAQHLERIDPIAVTSR